MKLQLLNSKIDTNRKQAGGIFRQYSAAYYKHCLGDFEWKTSEVWVAGESQAAG